MTGPQGSDPKQPYEGSDRPAQSPDSAASEGSAWQSPGYTPPQEYSPYQPPPGSGYATPQYPPPDYSQQPTYQPGQYGQPVYGQPQYGQPVYGQPQYTQPGQYGQPQYGQPPYGQPQYPGQPQYQQPGLYGPPAGVDQASSKRSLAALGTILGVLAALIVAAVLILGFWKPGFFVTTQLDVNRAQAGVQQILSDEANGYGAKNVKDVKCNNGQNPTVRKGDNFTCEVSIDGTKRQVTVTFQDNEGTYEVGRPK